MKKILLSFILLVMMGCEYRRSPTVIVEEDGIYYGYYDSITNTFARKKVIPEALIEQIKEINYED